MGVVMIHHLTGGEWGYFIRRIGEAAANVLPWIFILFVPILFGLRQLYPWADPHTQNAVVAHKRGYLNPTVLHHSLCHLLCHLDTHCTAIAHFVATDINTASIH